MAENLPRLMFFLDDLLEDPSIHIFACTKEKFVIAWLQFFGISEDRLICDKACGKVVKALLFHRT